MPDAHTHPWNSDGHRLDALGRWIGGVVFGGGELGCDSTVANFATAQTEGELRCKEA